MAILFEIPEVGEEVKLHGHIHGKATVLQHCKETKTVAIHFKGRGENPGSRYSGLFAYYPAHVVVYSYEPHDNFEALKLTSIIEWETSKKKSS